MSLSDFTPDTQDIIYKNKTLVTVRGLNLEDVGALMRNHLNDLQTVYGMFDPTGKLLPVLGQDVDNLIFSLVTNAPDTAAKMIAMASDEPNEVAKAKRLPAPLQIKILIAVVKLTFEDVGGPLEFGAALRRMFPQQAVSALSNNQTIQ